METDLIQIATRIAGKFELNGFKGNSAGEVAAALLTTQGNVYTGICVDVACSLGFCAEHAAIAEMLKNREKRVEYIVAVREDGKLLPPCGRCREMLMQIDNENRNTKVMLASNSCVTLDELLPFQWNS